MTQARTTGFLACLAVLLCWALWGVAPAWAQESAPVDETGAPPPDDPAWEEYAFDLPHADESGRLSFAELARGDQPFVLFWWLTDCPLCHLQMPYAEQLENLIEEHGLDVRFVSICVDMDVRDCLSYVEDREISFSVLFDRHAQRTEEAYHLEELGLPVTYVFDREGRLVDYLTGFRSAYATSVLRLLEITLPRDDAATEGAEEG
jgi:thiol-disulfide isomerase/thioredoxin